jgi:predicted 3-demethylubiquinone-9 3-methyltransferase (glyoxalase superfamily)
MQKIVPHLWFDKEAMQAAQLYVSAFPHSTIKSATTLQDTPSGAADVLRFELWGQEFQAINAGPLFRFNPSISFQVKCASKDEVDDLWNRLSPGGQVLMELGAYPFNQWYGWLQDRYGLSWQVLLAGQAAGNQKITPVFLFVENMCGKAEDAVRFWASVFHPAARLSSTYYTAGDGLDLEGKLKYGSFSLFGQEFAAMDGAGEHLFGFNEAISFMVNCDTQAEIDEYWNKLSHVPDAEQCGWLKDQYGVSWQVVPVQLGEMLRGDHREKIDRLTRAFLSMKKLDLARLTQAYQGH